MLEENTLKVHIHCRLERRVATPAGEACSRDTAGAKATRRLGTCPAESVHPQRKSTRFYFNRKEKEQIMIKNIAYGAVLSLQFLTRFPLPIACDINEASMKWALRFFPFAGFIIGGFMSLIYIVLSPIFPETIMTIALLSAWVYATGGLHLDGWMDVADALGSNAPLEKKYEIMKDSRVGSFAVIAVIFLFAWKAVILYELLTVIDNQHIILALLFIPMLARFQALLQLKLFPAIQNKGLAHEWRKYLSWREIVIAFVGIAVMIIIYFPFMFLFVLQVLFTILFGKWAVNNFKGINGDLVGTSIEGAELWNVAILYIFILFVMV